MFSLRYPGATRLCDGWSRREVLRENWELEGRDAPHVHHVTDDLAGFLQALAASR